MLIWCKKHDRAYDPQEGCIKCMTEIANDRLNKLEVIKTLYKEIPVFTMPFLNCDPKAIAAYINCMGAWTDKLEMILGSSESEEVNKQ